MTKVPHTGEEERERSRTEDAQRLRELETGRTRKLMRRLGQDLSQSVIATLVIGVLLLGSILTYVLTEGFSSELVWTALMLTGGSFAVFAIAFVFVPILV